MPIKNKFNRLYLFLVYIFFFCSQQLVSSLVLMDLQSFCASLFKQTVQLSIEDQIVERPLPTHDNAEKIRTLKTMHRRI
jgi:hypothetical protein